MSEYKTQRLSMANKRHSAQDVLTPFAVVLRAALNEANHRMYDASDNLFPLMNEAIELCYSRSPADIRHKQDGMIKPQAFRNWHPQYADTKFGLNCRLRVQGVRRARGSFVEPFDDRLGAEATDTKIKVECARQIWPMDLPSSSDVRQANLFIRMAIRCQNCGSKEHLYDACREQKSRCDYPHGPSAPVYPPHSTLMCPVLHSACLQCRVRGHREADHEEGLEQSPMQLRQTFLRYAHRGLFTCTPYLSQVR